MEKCVEELIDYYLKDEIEHFFECKDSGSENDNHIVGTWFELMMYLHDITQDEKYLNLLHRYWTTRGKNLTS